MRPILAGLALLLALAGARADIAPTPDAGPFLATIAGLEFEIQNVEVKMPPGYTKTFEVAVLTGCTAGHANCWLAASRHLIGMEVESVDGEDLRPELGRLHQIADIFAHAKGPVKIELYRRDGGQQATVSFARR